MRKDNETNCPWCCEPIFFKKERVLQPILAPITPEQEVLDSLPFEFRFLEHEYCPICGRNLSSASAVVNRTKNHVLTLEELNSRTDPVWVYVPDSPSFCPDGGYYSLCNHGIILPPSGLPFKAGERNWTFLDRRPTEAECIVIAQREAPYGTSK